MQASRKDQGGEVKHDNQGGRIELPKRNTVAWGDKLMGTQTRVGPGINQKFRTDDKGRIFRAEEAIHPEYTRFKGDHNKVTAVKGRVLYCSVGFDQSSDHAAYFARQRAVESFPRPKPPELMLDWSCDGKPPEPNAKALSHMREAQPNHPLKVKSPPELTLDWSHDGKPPEPSAKAIAHMRDTKYDHPPSLIKSVEVPNVIAREMLHRTEPQNPKDRDKYVAVHDSFSQQTKDIIKESKRARHFHIDPNKKNWHIQSADPTKGENLLAIHKKDISNINEKGKLSDLVIHRGGFARSSVPELEREMK